MLGRDSTKYKPCSEVATVTHVRSDSTILQSWSLSYEVEQGYIYAKSVGQQNRTTLLCLFLCRHLSPNAETRALVEEVLVTLEKVTTTSRALLEVASVTHIRSDSRILKSWSLIYEVERNYGMRCLSASRIERRCYAYSFVVHQSPNAERKAMVKDVWVTWRRWTSCFAQIYI